MCFFKALSDTLKSCPPDNVLILSGDFNSTLDRNHDEPHPQSAKELRAFVAYHGLVDEWREEFLGSRQFTWLKTYRNMLSGTKLDRIYVRKQDRGRFFKTSITVMGLSDHHYVTFMSLLPPHFIGRRARTGVLTGGYFRIKGL